MDTRVHVFVYGKVQGVWFRDSTVATAEALGLAGWVRNRRDGSVEAVFEGAGAAVEQAVAWCHTGPELARVDRVEVEEESLVGEVRFTRRPTA